MCTTGRTFTNDCVVENDVSDVVRFSVTCIRSNPITGGGHPEFSTAFDEWSFV
ncbi:hypothetical protein RSSM_03017 [Rhodopirellula sallentina SM41]|uniref:Uncharacterized protein n=1 Tax=Rhodopirellula sallentina SM41 TaxID=1263870 RepID=M5U269_9BACT|nr:hypothetical protein RSSM_03017 [Rhodopirellula sallentina SM41]